MANSNPKLKRVLIALAVFTLLGGTGAFLISRGLIWFNMPSKNLYPMRGVDVSHYQGAIDWESIRAQDISFAFIKATEGSGTVDECFAENWENARAAGLAAGAYHFFSFDSAGQTQAQNFCRVVPAEPDALPPVIDLEYYRSETEPEVNAVRKELRDMLNTLKQTYGKQPIIYTTRNYWKKFLKDTDFQYTLWIRSVFTSPSSDFEPQWTLWQYNPRGVLKGYQGTESLIDLNAYRGTETEFEQEFGVKIGNRETTGAKS